jgi:predicted kinase
MPHLLLLIGLPGSGKSSLTTSLMQQCPKRRIISTDTIRSQLFGDKSIQGSWLKIEQEIARQFQQTVHQIGRGEVSEGIYDATNAVRSQRRDAIALAFTCGFTQITGIWLKTPLWLCLQRNYQRDRQVPESVIFKMHRRLFGAVPSVEEGFDRLIELPPWFTIDSIPLTCSTCYDRH